MEEKKERPTLPFGKEVRIGNWKVLKLTKTLSKEQIEGLRKQQGVSEKAIKVEAISQIWSVEFCCNTGVYLHIDRVLPMALLADQEKREPEYESIADFAHLFSMWMTDTTVQGDSTYYADKGKALKGLIERQTALRKKAETPEEKAEDDKILEEVKAAEEAKAAIVDMKKGGTDEGN